MTRPGNRRSTLLKTCNLKMALSAQAYVRGSTLTFYEWLEGSADKLPHGPPVWICGDCHVGNLGPLTDAKGRLAIQIRDLDQTVIGNPAHDLIRLGLSLAFAARASDLPGVTTAKILEDLVAGYQTALAGHFGTDKDKSYRPKSIQSLLAQSTRRRWRHLAKERLDNVNPTIPLGNRFWILTQAERKALRKMFATKSVRSLLTSLHGREDNDPVELVDAAYWIKGCTSLGRLRYAALLRIGKGRGASLCLADVKEGTAAAAPRRATVKMPRDNAIRVVTGAKALSPNLGNRMISARLLGKAAVLRELMPQDLKIDLGRLTCREAMKVARYLGGVLGRAHGRQMERAVRKGWLADLTKNYAARLDAPSWLWSSVVELIALHEAAYLDHCRRYALSEAAQDVDGNCYFLAGVRMFSEAAVIDLDDLLILYFLILGPLSVASWVVVAGGLREVSGRRARRHVCLWIGLTIVWGLLVGVGLLVVTDIRFPGIFLAAWGSLTFVPSLLVLAFATRQIWVHEELRGLSRPYVRR
jgi:uncharacterized protein (DUF2252 family)